jgi:hypothetical protein
MFPHDQAPSSHDNSTRPFESEELFTSRVLGMSRFLRRNPELRYDISSTIQSHDDQSLLNTGELINIAQTIDTPVKQTPIGAIFDYLNLCRELDAIKIKTVGQDSPSDRANFLMQSARKQLLANTDDRQLDAYVDACHFVTSQLDLLYQRGEAPNPMQWFGIKTSLLHTDLHRSIEQISYIKDLPNEDKHPVTEMVAQEDSLEVEALFSRLTANQRYGVKLGYTQSRMRPGSFLFAPATFPYDGINVHQLSFSEGKNILAIVGDSSVKSHSESLYFREDGSIDQPGLRRMEIDLKHKIRSLYVLKDTGEIDFMTNCGKSFLTRSRELGRYNSYRMIQAEILSNYIELVCPGESSSGLREQVRRGDLSKDMSQSSGMDIVRTLLIPRIHQEENTQTDVDKSVRQVRLHGVVWHIRKLPAGWHASPEALDMATRAGIQLNENETFVRAHNRGSEAIGKVATHNFFKRQSLP